MHIEFTGESVTECVVGSHEIAAADLHERHKTACDPRLGSFMIWGAPG
jgi:3-deoxy-7-phosphoheptulonate synthase